MKFKVTPKDFFMFVLYCLLLLYFCAVAVLNFISFSNDGSFYGLLPFEAFTKDYIGFTFGLFIAALILIFTSVSSYIFDKEKGFGIGLNVTESSGDGYSKWSSEKDIKNDKGVEKILSGDAELKAAGIPLINKGTEIWVDNGEYHNLIIGATGSGKTECVVKPLVNILAKRGESMVITDPKGEIYEYCGENLKAQGYRIIILNFREPNKGNAWNPLALPYQYYKNGDTDKGIELLDDVALNILYEKNSGNSDSEFWEKSAADYFSGLALGLFMDAKEKEVNLNSINYMSTVGEERRGTTPYIKEYFGMKGEDSAAYIFASNTMNAPNDTKGGILSTFRQKIRLFSTRESLSEMLAYSDFDMRDIGKQKTAVFMIIHDEKKTYHGLMTIFVKQCYETLIDCAQKNGGKLTYRTNFILDEFPNMPPLKDVDSMVTAARSRDIRFTFIIQNFAQLNDVYGEEIAQVIKGNCGNLIYLISTELKALEEISKMCGEVKSKEKDKTASTPLITVSDLQKLKLFEAIIIRWRKSPFRTKLTPDFKIDWGVKYDKAKLPTREIQKVELFDLKKFVTDKKKEEELKNPNANNNNNNMFGGSGFNPFMPSNNKPFGSNMNNSPFGGGFNNTPSPFGSNSMTNTSPFGNNALSNGTSPFGNSSFGTPNNNNIFGNNNSLLDNSTPKANNTTTNNSESSTLNNNLPPFPNNNTLTTNTQNNTSSIENKDIDAMVKDIEKKLAELDEEEKKEKESKEKKTVIETAITEDKTKEVHEVKEEATSRMSDVASNDEKVITKNVTNNITINNIDKTKNVDRSKVTTTEVIENKEKKKESSKEDNAASLVSSLNGLSLFEPEVNNTLTIEDALAKIEKNEKAASKSKEDRINMTQEINLEEVKKSAIDVDKDSKIINENIVTDDEFYDDFFDD